MALRIIQNIKSNEYKNRINKFYKFLFPPQAYDKVASFEEAALKKLLEEVVCQKQNKNDKSAIAQLLIKKEEDALREESGSGEDTTEQRLKRQKKKKSICRKEHCVSHLGCSAAARNNTGGSLGSLQNLTDQKVPEQTNTNTQGVAARSRAGGSCGNLSKGSFETHTCKRRSRRSKEINRASTSQREGGSLQNLSKTEAASNEAKKLHKSGSLSQVFSDVGGVRLKNRRQKTSSESSSTRTFTRRSEDREPPESSEDEVGEFPYTRLPPSSHSSVSGHSCDTGENLVVMVGGGRWNGDHMSDVASGETTEEDGESSMHVTARAKLGDSSRHHHHDGSDTELHSVISHTAHRDVLPTISSDSEVDKPVNFGLCKNQEEAMSSSTSLPYTSVKSVFETKTTSKDDEVNEKRKLRNSKSENGSYEKSSYDENGNSVFMSVRSSLSGGNSGSSISSNCSSSSTTTTTTTTGAPIYSSVSCNDRHSSSSVAIGSIVPHTQPHIEQQPKQKQPSPPHPKQQPTVIYNTALSQKLSQHTQSLKFINQSIKSNNKSKVACSLTSSMQHQPISINYSSNRGNSVVKSERNKNTVPKEKTNNVNYNLKSSKTKDSTEASSGGNNIKNNKRYEAAVIFTDNAKFDLTNFEIEFGFDVTLENLTNLTDNVVESPNFTNTSVISNDTTINIKNLISDTTNTTAAATTASNNNKSKNFHPPVDFSKFYQAPVNDVISYNYEELCRHVYKGWESVLQMLEEDPKNIQYWKATDGDSGNNTYIKSEIHMRI
ncbi:hypothetical protein Anas_08591 [Armadillidium nasatum]|uniref:Uncharacterized protein n=1 Tax=Armadillidium nasatum TaxID=96803 RepID=A0A5N5SWX5_9CRUS|nr:hypothetical protein Anas_08591 [Armadillidium nasatum]